MFRQQNVTGITAIHHPLGHIDAGAGNVRLFVQIDHFVNRAAVDSHSNLQPRVGLERFTDLKGTKHRRFRSRPKNQRSAVTGWKPQQFAFGLRRFELFCRLNNRLQRLELFALLINQQFGIADDVDEQDMSDFELQLWRRRGRRLFLTESAVFNEPISVNWTIRQRLTYIGPAALKRLEQFR